MKLSIVIPLYNKEKYLERCLNSLLSQDISENDYEIIIVNDGSSDSSGDIATKYSRKFKNIKCFTQENKGVASARNVGLKKAKGTYIYFLDADDFLYKNVLQTLLHQCYKKRLELLEFDSKSSLKSGSYFDQKLSANSIGKVLVGTSYVAKFGFVDEVWRFIIKRNFLIDSNIKFREGTLFEDVMFSSNLYLRTNRISKINKYVHCYAIVKNSIVTTKSSEHNVKFIQGIQSAIRNFEKLAKNLDQKRSDSFLVLKKIEQKQQRLTFALIVRVLKFKGVSFPELQEILNYLKILDIYPMKLKALEGKQNGKFWIYLFFVPIFNNKVLLYLLMKLSKVISIS